MHIRLIINDLRRMRASCTRKIAKNIVLRENQLLVTHTKGKSCLFRVLAVWAICPNLAKNTLLLSTSLRVRDVGAKFTN
jgi:hypothetical protein